MSSADPASRRVERRPLRPITLPDAALHELRVAMAQGRYAPGDPIRVDKVAAELEISAIPVREALRVLAAEGRVTYQPHRGYRVTKLTLVEIEEIFLICRLLEGEALRRGVPNVDPAALERMATLLAEFEAARVGPGTEPALQRTTVVTHQEFHFVPYEAAGLPRLAEQLRRLWDHTDHYSTLYFLTDDIAQLAANAEHRGLYDACVAGDAALAVELMNLHRDHALERVRRLLDTRTASEPPGVSPPG